MKVKTTRLSNGVTVVTETMPHLESVALGVWVKSGSRDETAQEHGIAHLLEHMAFKGTHKRTARQIAEEIENVGGEVNAATSTETHAYYARVLKDNVPLAVDILHDILTNSVFDEGELTREKHVILQEIGAANDTPDDVVYDRSPKRRSRPDHRPADPRHARNRQGIHAGTDPCLSRATLHR
jgi:predicted Zn-dependent peptidase